MISPSYSPFPLYIEKETKRNGEREKVQMIRRLAAQNYNEVLLRVRDLDRISFGLYLLQSYFISKGLRIMLQDLLFLTIIIRSISLEKFQDFMILEKF